MRNSWFILDARQRGPELLDQSRLVASKRRVARASAGEVAQVDNELPAEATSRGGGGLREESCEQHHRDRYADENRKRRVEKCGRIIGHDIVDVRCEGEIHSRQETERADLRLRHDETASQHPRCERDRHRRKVDGQRHQVELGRENRERCDEHGRGGGHADLVRLLDGGEQGAQDRGDDDRSRAVRPSGREPNGGGDPDGQRGADSDQNRGNRVRPKATRDVRLRQLLASVESRHGVPKPGARVADVALVRGAYQLEYDPRVRTQRTAPMARGCFRRGAKLHRGLGQPAQRLVEHTRLGALEIRRTLHGLDVEISLGKLGTLGGDAHAIGMGVEQHRCEAIGAVSQSGTELEPLWRELTHKDQAAYQGRKGDAKQDLGAPRHHQGIGSGRLEGGRDADDCYRVAGELEAVGRKITDRTGRKVAETDPYGQRRHEELAVLRQTKYQRDRNKHSGDGAEDTIEALGENEPAIRLRYDVNRQKRPSWIVEASPECDVECEQGRGKCLDRKSQSDRRLVIEPRRLFDEPVTQRNARNSRAHESATLCAQCCICKFISSAPGIMLSFKLDMIQRDPATTRKTMSTPNASASTLLVLSGAVVMCRKKTR